MSKSKKKISPKKRVVTTDSRKAATTAETVTVAKKKIQPTRSRRTTGSRTVVKEELLFNRQNYLWMGIGFGLILLGMVLMSGGSMPSPDVWDDSIIYSWRRTVLAPFLMLAGLGVEVYAIFKK